MPIVYWPERMSIYGLLIAVVCLLVGRVLKPRILKTRTYVSLTCLMPIR